MPVISYAQNGEDILLRRVFAGQGSGFYIDIGANDPVDNSVTKLFSLAGWRGVNVEPVPSTFRRLEADRPGDVNLNCVASDRPGTLRIHGVPGLESYSTSPELLENVFGVSRSAIETLEVPAISLREICDRYAPETIDFLKVDVDGHERAVIAGGDWARWRPRVVLVEDLGTPEWEPILLGAGYHFAAFDGINRFYARDEDRALLPRFHPLPNYTDDFIPYRFQRQIDEYRSLLGEAATFGTTAIGVVRRLKRLSQRHPHLSRVVRGTLRWDR